MKTIKAIHDLVDYVADKGHTAPQRRKDIDTALYEASMTLFNEYLSEYEKSSTIHEYLSVFEGVEDFSSQTITGGKYPKPDDYERYTLIATDQNVPVDVVNNNRWAYAITDPVDIPSEYFPKCRVGNENIEIVPQDSKMILYYLKTPVQPQYVVDQSGVYDDTNSVDVEWTPSLFYQLANIVLSKLGINLRDQQIVQYSEQLKAQA